MSEVAKPLHRSKTAISAVIGAIALAAGGSVDDLNELIPKIDAILQAFGALMLAISALLNRKAASDASKQMDEVRQSLSQTSVPKVADPTTDGNVS